MKLLRLTLATVLLLCTLDHPAAQPAAPRAAATNAQTVPDSAAVRAALGDYFRKAAGVGFSGAVLAARGDEVLLRKGYGWADVRRRVPVTPKTIFDIGSGVKAFTATAVLQLEERGRLDTSDPISKHLKNVPADKAGITIHQLLTHTSGINFDYFYADASPEERAPMRDREKYLAAVLAPPLAFKPGEGRVYSNTGFSLLAAIIENLSGLPYERYVSEHLFKPAGMTETGYYVPRDLRRVARGYNDGDSDYGYPWESQWEQGRPLWDLMGNGGMLTTLDDVYKWMVAIRGEKIVSRKSKDKMFQIYWPKSDQGQGWNVWQTEGHPYVWRGGDAVPHGWNVEFRWYTKDDLIAVVLTNRRVRAGSLRRPTMAALVDIALLGKPPALPTFAAVSARKLRALEGAYKLESGETFYVKVIEAHTGGGKRRPVLMIGGEGQRAVDLLHSANDRPDLTKLSLEMNDKTAAYVEALRKKDSAALKAILPENVPPEEAVQRWDAFAKENGEMEESEVLGTSPLNQQGVQTFVRLKFRKAGVGVYRITWREGKPRTQSDDRLQPSATAFLRKSPEALPINLAFLPQSEREFATYDLFRGRAVSVGFPGGGKLVVRTKGGGVVAQKVKGMR
jgi:CubicO group peptidase (beta-lactamase class C family)